MKSHPGSWCRWNRSNPARRPGDGFRCYWPREPRSVGLENPKPYCIRGPENLASWVFQTTTRCVLAMECGGSITALDPGRQLSTHESTSNFRVFGRKSKAASRRPHSKTRTVPIHNSLKPVAKKRRLWRRRRTWRPIPLEAWHMAFWRTCRRRNRKRPCRLELCSGIMSATLAE